LVNINNTKSTGSYFPALKIRNVNGDHSFGVVSEFSTGTTGGDRPTVLFYSNVSNHSWVFGQVSAGWGVADSFGIGYRANNSPNTFPGWPSNYFAITTGGNVLIGTTTDNGDRMNISGAVSISSNLGVGRGSESGVRLSISGAGTSNAAYVIITRDSLGNDLFYVRNDGYTNTGSRASSPYNLTSGNAANMVVGADGTLYRSTSSLKYKRDVKDYDKGLAEVMQMRPVYYKGKTDGDTQFAGLIAEEIEELGLTEFVQYAKDGTPDALAYSNMVALLVKGMQELKAELDELKSKN
jgi:hypothetical protein